MRNGARWLTAFLVALVVIGMIVWARGPEHHRGDEVGALGAPAAVERV